MNKIDAFFVCFSLLLVWILAIFLIPKPYVYLLYATLAAWFVGTRIGSLYGELMFGTDKKMIRLLFDDSHKLLADLSEAMKIIRFQQARIDALMFEHCPDEMTPEQIGNYEAHVRAVSQQQSEEIEKALRH